MGGAARMFSSTLAAPQSFSFHQQWRFQDAFSISI